MRIVLGPFDVNCFLVYDTESREAMVIDPGLRSEELEEGLKDKKLKYIINTHGHFDHVGGNTSLKGLFDNVPLIVHELDAPLLSDPTNNLSTYFIEPVVSIPPDFRIHDEDFQFDLGKHHFETLLLPGHTPGGIGLYSENDKVLFSGDFIFNHSVGRTDMPGGDVQALRKSIERILTFPDDVMVYPGHEDIFLLSDFKQEAQEILALES